jgi:AraC-like DNA-binding protein
MLASLRLSGGLFLDGEFSAPWSVLSHISPEDCARFFPVPRHVVGYHFVRSGHLTCRVGDGDPVPVSAGEIVLLPRNEPHFLQGPVPAMAVDARTLLGPPEADGLFHVRWGGGGERTTVYCGYLGTTEAEHILLESLPSIMTVGVSQLGDDWVARTLDFAAGSLSHDSPEMVGKLAEGLFAEAVRRYVAAMPPEEMGWLAGLRDPAVGKTLALIHHRYAEAWTLDLLAREAGASKTVLVDRFRALIGDSPMQYCARWRMRVAAQMLRSGRHNSGSVAYSVGFNSEAAFNRAFKREYGTPPATWRRERAG